MKHDIKGYGTRQQEAYRRFNAGEKPSWSTGICGGTTAGYGELDQNGYWEFPLWVHQGTLEVIPKNV